MNFESSRGKMGQFLVKFYKIIGNNQVVTPYFKYCEECARSKRFDMGLDKVGCRIDRDYPPPRGYMCKYTDVFLLFLAEAISYKTLQIDPNTVECSGCKKKICCTDNCNTYARNENIVN